MDANQRYDPPRCTEGTRRHVMQTIEDWVRHDTLHDAPSSVFWLYGGAGAGKSALAQTLAEKFKTSEELAASFFFFKADVNRNNGNCLIPTLAYQLLQSFQGLGRIVANKILQNLELFERTRQAQMLELLVEPLIKLSIEETEESKTLKPYPRLIVIDGLDECKDPDTQCDLLRIVAIAIHHFPYPLRFLITSRPESHITRAFQHDLGQVVKYDLSDDSYADKDIRNFLEEEFAKIRSTHPRQENLPSQWPPQDSISSIVERSSRHFIYAATVMRFIQSPRHWPDERLQVILGLKQPYEKDEPYARLDLLYRVIFLEVQEPGGLEMIHRALGIMHLRSVNCGIFALSRWTSNRHVIEELLELRPGALVLIFDPLLSLVTFDYDNIRIFHKSLFDYLLDSSRSGDFQLDLGLAHQTAASHILRKKKPQHVWSECLVEKIVSCPTFTGSPGSAEFQNFVYHCQFALLNETLTSYLRSLACDPKIISELLQVVQSQDSSFLQSILYLLQVVGRQVSKRISLQSDLIPNFIQGF